VGCDPGRASDPSYASTGLRLRSGR
jgi:hypothetical protein